MSGEFSGKRALVTGSTRGIGEAIVRRLRDGGAILPDGLGPGDVPRPGRAARMGRAARPPA
jgi:NAD(P)-dependent dehydrogenase (short-subunit alcohol dehydrogenase family)